MPRTRPLALFFLAATLGTAHAASDDAWADFAKTVEEKCLAAAGETIEEPRAVVDPFGSERFGLAIITGKAKGAEATISHICVMDKQSQTVELGSEISTEVMRESIGHRD